MQNNQRIRTIKDDLPAGYIICTLGVIESTDLFWHEYECKWFRVPEGGIGLNIEDHYQPIAKKA